MTGASLNVRTLLAVWLVAAVAVVWFVHAATHVPPAVRPARRRVGRRPEGVDPVNDQTDRREFASPAHTFFNVDVECTATTPSMGYLLTVGIVPVVHDGTLWALHRDRLYVRLDQGEVFPEPLHYTSMPWWREQSEAAQNEAYRDRTLVRHKPHLAAEMISEFVAEVQPDWSQRFFTANPVSFDKPWLDDLFASAGIPSPFHYRSLCLRSMRFGMDPSKGFGSSREAHDPAIPHHALHDAEAQALDLLDMLNGAEP